MANALRQQCVKDDDARTALLSRFSRCIEPNPSLDRTLVSFQANRNTPGFRWYKYKEAFSADLAQSVIRKFGRPGGTLLDPFAGVGTALFTARANGMPSIGIEVLPVGFFVMDARLAAESVAPKVFKRCVDAAAEVQWESFDDPDFRIPHIPITHGAFSRETEAEIGGYRAYCSKTIRNTNVRKLFELAALSALETVSFTRKDGQYLRWDYRARKARVKQRFDKGQIPRFADAIRKKLLDVYVDLPANSGGSLFDESLGNTTRRSLDLRLGSCLEALPKLEDENVDLVLTSPPYCNRYDYTRTYALELVYLGYGGEDVKRLRQQMLSCTVENREKTMGLRDQYSALGRTDSFERVEHIMRRQSALQEVLAFLERERDLGRLNNANVPRMIRNYFFEMCCVVHELSRILRLGGHVVMVNDNVRYHGQEVPVDLILCDFASKCGLKVENIWTLTRGKGNSSQQMGAHGREELRKCVYVWRKSQ